MRVTIRDVAREAGVSVTTASRAINNKGEITPETRAHILAVAERLGYVPSAVARALVSGQTHTLGVVVNNNASPVYAQVLRGIEEVANAAGFGVLLCNSADNQDQALRCLAMLRAKGVDGVLLTPIQVDRRDLQFLQDWGISYVLLVRHFPDHDSDYVVVDNVTAAFLVTRHLLDHGHRRIGHIAGPPYASTTIGRLAGFRRALADHGVPVTDALVIHGSFDIEGGQQAAQTLLDRTDRPTAIVAATDLQAIGALKAARALGLRVPDDLAIVGGDDIALAEFAAVPLTTFRVPLHEIGARAAEIVLARLAGRESGRRQLVLQPTLVVRRSCGCEMP